MGYAARVHAAGAMMTAAYTIGACVGAACGLRSACSQRFAAARQLKLRAWCPAPPALHSAALVDPSLAGPSPARPSPLHPARPAVALSTSRGWQLVGVVFASRQGGLGEASCLAMTSHFRCGCGGRCMWGLTKVSCTRVTAREPAPETAAAAPRRPRTPPTACSGRPAITMWSSGTGFAGVFGYAWVALLHLAGELPVRCGSGLPGVEAAAAALWGCSTANLACPGADSTGRPCLPPRCRASLQAA